MARNLGIALALIGALVAAMILVVSRANGPSNSSANAVTPAVTDAGVDPGEASRALMPAGYGDVALGMTLTEVRRVRRAIQPEPSGMPHPEGYRVWYEDDGPGNRRALYLFAPTTERLAQVQFAGQIRETGGLTEHLREVDERLGAPTGAWNCSDPEGGPPVRRFTWRREGASAMDAVLVQGQRVAVTFIVAPTDSVARSLRRAQCVPVRSAEELARFPTAGPDASVPAPNTLRQVQ